MKAIKTTKRKFIEFVVTSAIENNTFNNTVDWDGVWSDVSAEFPYMIPSSINKLIEPEYSKFIKRQANREEGLYYG